MKRQICIVAVILTVSRSAAVQANGVPLPPRHVHNDKIVTHYRVILTNSALRLHRVSIERFDSLDRPVDTISWAFGGAFAALAAAAIGVIYVRRRWPRSAAAAPLREAQAGQNQPGPIPDSIR